MSKPKAKTVAQLFAKTERSTLQFPLTDKYLILKPKTLRPEYQNRQNLVWLARWGFGCSEQARGTAVYATCVATGEEARWERGDFEAMFIGDIEALKQEAA